MELPFSKIESRKTRRDRVAELMLYSADVNSTTLSVKEFYNLRKISFNDSSQIIQQYKDLRADCDKKAYSVKWLDDIGEKITDAVTPAIRPIIKAVHSAYTAAEPVAQSITKDPNKIMTNIVGKTSSILSEDDRFCKLARFCNPDISGIHIAEKKLLALASQEGIYAESLDELSFKVSLIRKKSADVSQIASSVSGLVGKGLKNIGTTTLKLIPFVGIATDLTLMSKNIYEAWINGKKIIEELPLDKYGINVLEATIPTPENTVKVAKQLESLCHKYKDYPSNLSEILNISQTLKGYGTDFVSIITNLFMTILDILEFTGLGVLVSFVISIPIIALEMANDTLVETSYDKSINLIRSTCDDKIKGLSEVVFDDTDKDFIRSFLSELDTQSPSDEQTVRSTS